MAAVLVHDLNNLLAAARGYAELALDEVEKGSDLDLYLAQIIEAVDRARQLVQQLPYEKKPV